MEKFLEKTASLLIDTYGKDISEICIVLPNKRAGLFLKQHLSKLIEKPIWLPEILGAEDLVEKLSDVQIVDNVILLFELYLVYRKTIKDPESFDEFSKWGQILLHDFNEIDRYLIPTDNFFQHINEVRALEVWNLGEKEITEFQSQYIKFWKQIGTLYYQFNEHLDKKKIAYQGSVFRKVGENISNNPEKFISDKIQWDTLVFIGFNALNKAEETIITELKKQKKAAVIWDADKYYMDDEIQESGIFLRQYRKKEIFTPFNWISDRFNDEKKEIEILGIPQNVGQAKYITSIIDKLDSINDYKDTAVVLADENMLVPVLQSIPEEVENINVTMGYPLKSTPLNNFFEIYLTTFLNADRYGSKNKLTYHYKDLLKLFQLPFTQLIFGKEICKSITEKILKSNWVFINGEKIDFINKKVLISFDDTYTIDSLLKKCLSFIRIGQEYYSKNDVELGTPLELEYLFQYAKLFNQLSTLNTKYPFLKNAKSFYSLYHQLLGSYTIELYGEPLKGMQVMGMLETRNIDFKNVILLSTNEGVLPAGKTYNSFIPFDVKKAYSLPTHIEKDAIYAYHFYRLIQHADNIFILYNTETNEFGSGEQSRFVTQIENELKQKENIFINKKIVNYQDIKFEDTTIEVKKTQAIIDKILERLEEGVSPSALNSFVNCPMDFYYKYVLGVRESDEVEETIDHSSFGSYAHRVLEILYNDFVGKNLTEQDLKEMLKKVASTTYNVFAKDLSDKELKSGKNLLTLNVAENYIVNFLKSEIDYLRKLKGDLFIKSLESELNVTLNIELKGTNYPVNIKGIVDRIDIYNDYVRIIDYKTGLVEQSELKITNVDELLIPNKKNKALQVLMYAFLYSKNNSLDTIKLQSGIISFRKLSNQFMALTSNKNVLIDQQTLSEFECLIKQIVTDLLDENAPFVHNESSKYCRFCN